MVKKILVWHQIWDKNWGTQHPWVWPHLFRLLAGRQRDGHFLSGPSDLGLVVRFGLPAEEVEEAEWTCLLLGPLHGAAAAAAAAGGSERRQQVRRRRRRKEGQQPWAGPRGFSELVDGRMGWCSGLSLPEVAAGDRVPRPRETSLPHSPSFSSVWSCDVLLLLSVCPSAEPTGSPSLFYSSFLTNLEEGNQVEKRVLGYVNLKIVRIMELITEFMIYNCILTSHLRKIHKLRFWILGHYNTILR